ncbi:hypothetical protein KIW84_010592 [Lathyrus oleraceus]|uniref:Uncharacterized protein n=1 Tax=Pisum sativum TaxID=3888 RepID=A0A9D4YKE2_PEA|nr:hypothetical protein KIW84_010592 [Pisum sativum]
MIYEGSSFAADIASPTFRKGNTEVPSIGEVPPPIATLWSDFNFDTLQFKSYNLSFSKEFLADYQALRSKLTSDILDHYGVITTKCTEDSTTLKEYTEQDRVYDFLVGLNSDFDQVRIKILGKEKVPKVNEVVAIVRSEESRMGLIRTTRPVKSSVMLAKKNSTMIVN